MRARTAAAAGVLGVSLLAGCDAPAPAPPPVSPLRAPGNPASPAVPATRTSGTPPPVTWQVGARPLPLRPDGFGEILPTPPELVNRALPTRDLLPPPTRDRYAAKVTAVPADVLARSTWQPACPVASADLRYVTLSFWGFDGRAHTGELLVRQDAAKPVTDAFGELFAQRFPIEEMRITAPAELDAAPTGDGNNTSAFVCRPARGQASWSAHAYGLAVDVDPFCNPYTKSDLVLPELASSYLDRKNVRPGMVLADDPVVRAFAREGWQWGGAWRSPTDRMHFTATGA
ncbi:M15 family metallopeptidase [Amycolatopsis panacis]|uniref:M15 family peptidase n=1 Tax=Amycolatopsis panacis TaxID=2340917 RepID=A0A419HPH5_9PSEU|nr:M15 family metallopeptidase [Amycolatopsis panacis]RJQ78260.1 M15 family peptidase [Amycolatopsis panacis]